MSNPVHENFLPFKIEQVGATDPKDESVNCLIYGPSRAGKTNFCGTAGSRSAIINIGAGLSTITSPGFIKRYGKITPLKVDILERLNEEGIVEAAKAFDLACDAIDYLLKHRRNDFDNLIVDDATALRKFSLNKALEINSKLKKSSTLSDAKSKFDGALIPQVQDFGTEMNLTEQFIDTYCKICKDAGVNFIVTAHERLTFGKAPAIGQPAPIIKIRPGFTGQTFPDQVTGMFDWVLYAQAVGGDGNTKYRVKTTGNEILVAGVRDDGVFKPTEDDPNFLKMLHRVRVAKGLAK